MKNRNYQVFLLGTELQNDTKLLDTLKNLDLCVGLIDTHDFGESVLTVRGASKGSDNGTNQPNPEANNNNNSARCPSSTSSGSSSILPTGNTPIGKRLPPSAFDALAKKHATPIVWSPSKSKKKTNDLSSLFMGASKGGDGGGGGYRPLSVISLPPFSSSASLISNNAAINISQNLDISNKPTTIISTNCNSIANNEDKDMDDKIFASHKETEHNLRSEMSSPAKEKISSNNHQPPLAGSVINFERILGHYFDPQNPFYVVSDFSGNFFDKLQREKFGRRLVGPPFIRQVAELIPNVLQEEQQIPEVRHPIYCLSMRGLNLCFSRFTNTLSLTNLVCMAQYMGATVRKNFNGAKVTHLVSLTAQGDKYRAAANLGKPVMSQEWITHCWEHRFETEFDPLKEDIVSRFKLKPFIGCCISFIGFSNDERSHMEEQAFTYGAKVTDCEDNQTTHIVVDEQNVKVENLNFAACSKNNVIIVKAEWFWVSIQVDFCADEKLYYFKGSTLSYNDISSCNDIDDNRRLVKTPSSMSASNHSILSSATTSATNNNDFLSLNALKYDCYQSPRQCQQQKQMLNYKSSASGTKADGGNQIFLHHHLTNNNAPSPKLTFKSPSGEHTFLDISSTTTNRTERSFSTSILLDSTRAESSIGRTSSTLTLEKTPGKIISGDLCSIINYNECQSARQMTAVEILNTERNYVNCLEIIRNVYQKPLEESITAQPHNLSYLPQSLVDNNTNHFGTLQPHQTTNSTHSLQPSFSFDSSDIRYLPRTISTISHASFHQAPPNFGGTTHTTTTHQLTRAGASTLSNYMPANQILNNLPVLTLNSSSNNNPILPTNPAANKPLLDPTEIKAIFGYLPPIHEVHKRMLVDLTNVLKNYTDHESSIGNVILAHVDGMLKAYPPFINFFHDSKNTLKICDQNKPKFHAFLKICQNKLQCGRQSLEDLMIRPVQRLPSLILLLSDLLKHTPEYSEDRVALNEAINAVKNVLDQINEGKRKTETQLHMFEIVNDIENCPPNLLSSQRTFVQRAYVQGLTNETSVKGRHLALFLFNDCLEICKRRNVPSYSLNKINLNLNFLGVSLSSSFASSSTITTSNPPPCNLNNGPLLSSNHHHPSTASIQSNGTTLGGSIKTSSAAMAISKMASKTSITSGVGLKQTPSSTSSASTGTSTNYGNVPASSNASSTGGGGSKNYKHVELLHLSHIKIIGDIIDNQEFVNAFAIICSSSNFNGDTPPNHHQFSSEGRLMLFALDEDEKTIFKAQLLEALHKNTVNTLCLSDGRSILRPIHPDEMNISSPSSLNTNGTFSKAIKTAKKLLSRKMSRAFSFTNKATPLKLKRTVSTISSLASSVNVNAIENHRGGGGGSYFSNRHHSQIPGNSCKPYGNQQNLENLSHRVTNMDVDLFDNNDDVEATAEERFSDYYETENLAQITARHMSYTSAASGFLPNNKSFPIKNLIAYSPRNHRPFPFARRQLTRTAEALRDTPRKDDKSNVEHHQRQRFVTENHIGIVGNISSSGRPKSLAFPITIDETPKVPHPQYRYIMTNIDNSSVSSINSINSITQINAMGENQQNIMPGVASAIPLSDISDSLNSLPKESNNHMFLTKGSIKHKDNNNNNTLLHSNNKDLLHSQSTQRLLPLLSNGGSAFNKEITCSSLNCLDYHDDYFINNDSNNNNNNNYHNHYTSFSVNQKSEDLNCFTPPTTATKFLNQLPRGIDYLAQLSEFSTTTNDNINENIHHVKEFTTLVDKL